MINIVDCHILITKSYTLLLVNNCFSVSVYASWYNLSKFRLLIFTLTDSMTQFSVIADWLHVVFNAYKWSVFFLASQWIFHSSFFTVQQKCECEFSMQCLPLFSTSCTHAVTIVGTVFPSRFAQTDMLTPKTAELVREGVRCIVLSTGVCRKEITNEISFIDRVFSWKEPFSQCFPS